jgi:hypothetical protein
MEEYLPRGVVIQPRGPATRSRGASPLRQAKRYGSRGHPIAPTEFPGGPSTTETFRPEGLRALRYGTPRRRIPAACHARGRVQATVCPRMFRANVGHRPVIHSPQRHLLLISGVSAAGRRLQEQRPASVILSGHGPIAKISRPYLQIIPATSNKFSETATCAVRGAVAERGPLQEGGTHAAEAAHSCHRSHERPKPACGRVHTHRARAHPAAPILGQGGEHQRHGTLPL